MLYTLIGNANANVTEVLATLNSLRSAVVEPDEFWMAFMDISDGLSDTVTKIVEWLDNEAIYYEVVSTEGVDLSPVLKNADEEHVARRPLDFLIKLTKARVQPGEHSAILILSDDLDNDNTALYAVERAVAEGIPVFDVSGQMTQIELEEDEPEPLQDTQLHEAAVEANEVPETAEQDAELLVNSAQDLIYTRADLEELSRDELKALVKTQGVTPTDLRSKESMIDALMGKQESSDREVTPEVVVEQQPKLEVVPDVKGEDLPAKTTVITHPTVPVQDGHVWLLRISPTGEPTLEHIPESKVALIDTILAEG